MTIASEITRIQNGVASAYTSVSTMGGTLPATQNLTNLPTAIESIPAGGGSKYGCTADNFLGDVNASGVLQVPTNTSGDIVFTGVKDVAANALNSVFAYNSSINCAVSFPDLENITGGSALNYAFRGTSITSVSFPNLENITSSQAYCFSECRSLTSASFPKLKKVSFVTNTFSTCVSLTNISFPLLEEIQSFSYFFQNCTALTTMSFDSLIYIGGACFQNAFQGCRALTSLSFPAVTESSFASGYTGHLSNMFNSYTASTSGACTVHFPSNVQTKVSSLSGYPTFGGSSSYITIAFDLPATE